jgi:hypothetical protein
VVTAAADLAPVEHPVPSVTPHHPVGPETRMVAVVPPPAAPWEPASAVVPMDRVAATLGESAEAARRRAAAVAKSFPIGKRSAHTRNSVQREVQPPGQRPAGAT